jgi:hypothetical protein
LRAGLPIRVVQDTPQHIGDHSVSTAQTDHPPKKNRVAVGTRIVGVLAVAFLIWLVLGGAAAEASQGPDGPNVTGLVLSIVAPIWFAAWRIRRVLRNAGETAAA